MSKFNGFFDNFAGALGNPKGNVGDFAHASALYVRNNLRLTPKIKFLYHVVFDINQIALQSLGNANSQLLNKKEVNLLVQSVDLPGYTISTDTLNQYNRKKIIQTKINYDPISLVFHDDQAGLTTLLWETYFRYYFQDPNYARRDTQGQPDTSVPLPYIKDPDNTYGSELRNNYRYGLDRSRPSAPFFNSITVNQLHGHNAQSNFTSFTLINPMIASLRHDTLDQTSSNFLQNEMRIEYESVMYGRGLTAVDNPAGFADPSHYDVTPSPLTIAGGGVSNLFGAGGITEGISSVFSDLENGQVNLSTILTGFNTIQNIENYNDTNAAAEWQDIKDGVILAGTSALLNYAFNQPAGNTSLTQSQQVQDNSQTIFGLTRNDALNTLNTNQQARDDFAFRNVYFNSQQSGNLNDRKSSWNSLSRSQKNEFGQTAIDNFDNIRNAQ
jgi:hypothetical protein|tara:strand:- start:1474 stop:2796 length:1323 start_codon:yes stop_codon:yes gene_type:complete